MGANHQIKNTLVVKTGYNCFEVRINGITVYEAMTGKEAQRYIKAGCSV